MEQDWHLSDVEFNDVSNSLSSSWLLLLKVLTDLKHCSSVPRLLFPSCFVHFFFFLKSHAASFYTCTQS